MSGWRGGAGRGGAGLGWAGRGGAGAACSRLRRTRSWKRCVAHPPLPALAPAPSIALPPLSPTPQPPSHVRPVWRSEPAWQSEAVGRQAVREAAGQVELPSPSVVTEASELVEGDSCI